MAAPSVEIVGSAAVAVTSAGLPAESLIWDGDLGHGYESVPGALTDRSTALPTA